MGNPFNRLRTPMWAGVVALAAAICIGCFFCLGFRTTTVCIVRHAEKTPGGADPPLSQAGFARAQALAHVLEEAQPAVAYRTQFLRTGQTAQPLNDRFGTPIVTINLDPLNVGGHIDDLKSDVLAHYKGQRVVIVGHGNTVPGIIEAFGGGTGVSIMENEYDHFYVLTLQEPCAFRFLCFRYKKVRLLRLKYGVET